MNNEEKQATKFFQNKVDDYKKEFYESGYRTFMSVRLQRFLEEVDRLELEQNAKCLDAGCGPGYLTKALYERGYSTCAFDASPEMLRLTKEQFANLPADSIPEIIKGDIETLPFENCSFDLVASAGVIEYLSRDEKVMNEFYRVLKPGGHLILSSTNKYSPIGIFEPFVEALKRNQYSRSLSNWILRKLGHTPVRPREFKVRKHVANEFKTNAEAVGFEVIRIGYFYGLPWPHPLDRIFPKLSNYLGKKLEYFNNTLIARTFEGLYIVAKKV
jgi:ubiquinone/menaquinone biosynthesis C-methylase UbiE